MQEKCSTITYLHHEAFGYQDEYRIESDETSFRGIWRFVDYRLVYKYSAQEGAKHFRQPDILVASRSGQKSEIKWQSDVAMAI